jgi:hypothetical protein
LVEDAQFIMKSFQSWSVGSTKRDAKESTHRLANERGYSLFIGPCVDGGNFSIYL